MGTASEVYPVKALLLDMDGVLYVGKSAIEGAAECIDYLRAQQIPFRFITNTTTRTTQDLCSKLEGFGITAEAGKIFSAVSATRHFLLSQGKPSVHLLLHEKVRDEFSVFPHSEQPDFVVIGDIGKAWNYAVLNKAFNMLMQGSRLIAMHHNKYWQKEDGLYLDIGAFVAGLEYAAGVGATVIGKPSITFFQQAVDALQFPAEQIAIIGDDIDSDIGGGQDAGLQGVLVKTGKYRREQVADSAITPAFTLDSIADLVKALGL